MSKRFIDFFAGIGGFRLGLELAGWQCVGSCEKDKFSRKSYTAMYDTKGEWYRDDITTIKYNEVPRADLWTAGSPCQNLSLAGKREGLFAERSGLFFNLVQLLKSQDEEAKPEWILFENVKGLLSSNRGWDFYHYLFALSQAGYDLQWQVFNSRDFGVPHNRERVYTIGRLRSRGRCKVFPICRTGGTPTKQIVGGSQGNRVYDGSGSSVCLNANGGGDGGKTGLYLIDQSSTQSKITNDCRCLTARYTSGISKRKAQNSAVLKIKNGTKKGFQEASIGDSVNLAYPSSNTRRARVGNQIANTLTANQNMGVVDWNGKQVQIRRLTPKECFRLQGFPDELFEKARGQNSDAQLYKQAGNAVTVPVVKAIGLEILRKI